MATELDSNRGVWTTDANVRDAQVWMRGPWRVFPRIGTKARTWGVTYRFPDGRVGWLMDRSGKRAAWWRSAEAARNECSWRSMPGYIAGLYVEVSRLEGGFAIMGVERVETPLPQEAEERVETPLPQEAEERVETPLPQETVPMSGERKELPPRVYPVDHQASEDDKRFTFGLTLDVATVLKEHGYPEVAGLDFVDLQQALYRFVYKARG